MNNELYTFIKELIEEIDSLQQFLDGDYSTNFNKSDSKREQYKEELLAKLEQFKKELK